MLEPITKKMTDESDDTAFRFAFYCDVCGSPWRSIPYGSSTCPENSGEKFRDRERERFAAYERANQEAMRHFNRCPICKRVVCDNCFRILTEQDMCDSCAAKRREHLK